MVHGTDYGVQYEIYLNKELDLYNDILSICIDLRKMIKFEKIDKYSDQYKLVIIPYSELDKRLSKNNQVYEYINCVNKITTNGYRILRRDHPEIYKYYDVYFYKKNIKHMEFVEPYTKEEFELCEQQLDELRDISLSADFYLNYSDEQMKKISHKKYDLEKIVNIQRIISNSKYFEEIKSIEQDLTNIEITDEEKELVDKVLKHPKLEGSIKWYGINLIESYY